MENKTKYRIVYLYQLLVENSDESHPLSTIEIIDRLKTKYVIDRMPTSFQAGGHSLTYTVL